VLSVGESSVLIAETDSEGVAICLKRFRVERTGKKGQQAQLHEAEKKMQIITKLMSYIYIWRVKRADERCLVHHEGSPRSQVLTLA